MKTKNNWLSSCLKALRASNLGASITRLQGDLMADTVICGPPVTDDEIDENLSWCNPVAQLFFGFVEGVGFNANEFLIIPLTLEKTKPAKASTHFTRVVVELAAKQKHVNRFVCIGGDAFKHLFGSGKKPSMQTLGGATIRLKQLQFKPMFIFPSVDGLNAGLIQLAPTRGEEFKAKMRYNEELNRFQTLMPKFKLFMEEL